MVLDSGSNDNTCGLAAELGARVVHRRFDSYAGQRNFGLKEITYKHDWILMIDADERVPADLRDEILEKARSGTEEITLYLMRRRDHLFGRWIRHSSGYPTWFGRLGRRGEVWVERPINEIYHTSGNTGRLQGHLHHYPFNKGFSAWIAKHNVYSSMEAELLMAPSHQRSSVAAICSRDPVVRRQAQKRVAYALPGRPLLIFFALYLFKGGFLEGRAGLTFCLLRTWYEYMIDCKHRELLHRRQGLPV